MLKKNSFLIDLLDLLKFKYSQLFKYWKNFLWILCLWQPEDFEALLGDSGNSNETETYTFSVLTFSYFWKSLILSCLHTTGFEESMAHTKKKTQWIIFLWLSSQSFPKNFPSSKVELESLVDWHWQPTNGQKNPVGLNPGNLGIQKSRDFTPFPEIRLG